MHRTRVQRLHQVAEQQGRDPKSIGLAFYAGWFDEVTRLSTPGGERHILTGTAAEIAEDIDGLAAQGVTDLVLNFQRATLEQSLSSMQHFCDEIRPLIGR